jgi:hypothetical protein
LEFIAQKNKTMKLSFTSKKSSGYIFDYLADMQKFVSVHPVITKIDKHSDNNYLVHETLKFAGIPFPFTYPVTIEPLPLENRVMMQAKVMKLIKIEMTFVLKAANSFTVVEDSIVFRSVLPVKFIMQGIFKKQHQQLFKNIEMAN